MRFASSIIALCLLLTACSMSPSDSEIRQKVTGTWIPDSDATRASEIKPDGSFVVRCDNAVRAEGTWCVKGGVLISTVTNAPPPHATLEVWRDKVVSIDRYKMVMVALNAGTNEFVTRKQRQ